MNVSIEPYLFAKLDIIGSTSQSFGNLPRKYMFLKICLLKDTPVILLREKGIEIFWQSVKSCEHGKFDFICNEEEKI